MAGPQRPGSLRPAAPKSTPTIARRKTDAPMALVRGEKTKKTTPSEPERRRVSNDQQDCGPVPPEFRVFSPSQILPLAGRIFMQIMCMVKRQCVRRQDSRSDLAGKNVSGLLSLMVLMRELLSKQTRMDERQRNNCGLKCCFQTIRLINLIKYIFKINLIYKSILILNNNHQYRYFFNTTL